MVEQTPESPARRVPAVSVRNQTTKNRKCTVKARVTASRKQFIQHLHGVLLQSRERVDVLISHVAEGSDERVSPCALKQEVKVPWYSRSRDARG